MSSDFFSHFERQIQAAQYGLSKLQESESELSAAEKTKLASEFAICLEELHITTEELLVNNTQLLEAREQLEREREQYRNLFDFAPDGYIATDKHGTIQNANCAAETLLGVRRDRLKNKPLIVFVAADSHLDYYSILDNLSQPKPTWEIELCPRHGKPFPAAVSLAVERDIRGEIARVLWIIRDISERLAAEQKIRALAELLEVTTDAILVVDLENKITFCNSSSEKLYGWLREEILNRDFWQLWDKKLLSELEVAKKSVLEQGEWRGELKKQTHQDEILVESHWSLVRDERGKPQRIMIVDTNITDKKRLELQTYHSQRLESLGTLAGGIAHDLNNILNPILGSTQILLKSLANIEGSNLKLLHTIEKNAKRGAAIVSQILAHSRSQNQKLVSLNIGKVLEEVKQTIAEIFPRAIALEIEIPENLSLVEADSTQVFQAVLNLCINARDAMPEGGKLTLTAAERFIDESYAQQNLAAHVGNYVTITIADTGIGIPPDTLKRIFEPFFTTKDIGKGTGLGLFTVREIIRSHGGFLNVASQVAQGTKFELFFPVADRELHRKIAEVPAPREAKSNLAATTATASKKRWILVVDDERDNLEMTEAMLDLAGYRAICANSGNEAIALLRKHRGEIELVLMDMMMPKMDGLTAIDRLVKIEPQIKVIALSGLASEYSSVDCPHIVEFINKPVVMQDLLAAIAKVLQNT